MTVSRNIIIAGGGIGGLTAGLMLARSGFRVTIMEQADRLEETGAGIQLSPNATRILIALGLGERLKALAFAPEALSIRKSSGGRLARVPFGAAMEQEFGAPYWSIHRSDLQKVLLDAVTETPDITLRLGTKVDDFVLHANGISVACQTTRLASQELCTALIGADGLWSVLRPRIGHKVRPEFQRRTAWRAMLPADKVEPEFRGPDVQLWLGRHAHLVHYPVRGGALINVVAIVRDRWSEPGWSAEGDREELLKRYSKWSWAEPVRDFLALPERWVKWALHDIEPLGSPWGGDSPVTLLGDAAHPMLPFLAQGTAMAIEDAAVLTDELSRDPDDPASAMRRYERTRRARTARVQQAARSNGNIYHLTAGEAVVRNLFLRLGGGKMMLRRYKWLYDWQAPMPAPAARADALPSAIPGDEE